MRRDQQPTDSIGSLSIPGGHTSLTELAMAHSSLPPIHDIKRAAKRLRNSIRQGDAASIARARAIYHDLQGISDAQVSERITLLNCQHVLAREQGCDGWADLLNALEAQATKGDTIVTSPDPDITWKNPLAPGESIDGITGERRQIPTALHGVLMGDLSAHNRRRWSPSVLHPSLARYASRQSGLGREAWVELLKEVSAWAIERDLNAGWPLWSAPEAPIYEFDICTSHERLRTARFDRAAFEAAFVDRIQCIEVFALLDLSQGTLRPDAPPPSAPSPKHHVIDKENSYEAMRAVLDLKPLYGDSRGKGAGLLLLHRDGTPFVLNPFAVPPGHGPLASSKVSPPESEDEERERFAESCRGTPLSPQHLREIRHLLHDDLGIEPTDDQIRTVIPPGSETHAIICTYGVEGDTATRDEVADRFCEHLVGRPHPLGIDGLSDEQLDAFAESVIAAARRAGMPVANDRSRP